MTLRLFAAREGSATLWELDDPSVFTDEGTAIVGTLEAHPVDFGPAKGYGRLRQFVQWFALYGTAEVTVTPIADGRTIDDPDVTTEGDHYVVTIDGQRVVVESGALVTGHNRIGRAIVWPYSENGKTLIRCFMPGAGI